MARILTLRLLPRVDALRFQQMGRVFCARLTVRVVRGLPGRLVLLLLGLGLLRRPCRALAFLDQPLDLLPTLAADLLVEVRSAGGFDAVAALFPDLFVELGSPLRLDRLAAFAADFLVEGTPAFGLDGRTPFASDGLVELAASLVPNGFSPFPTG